jgi:ABC-2 type transport system permease protein
MTRLRLLRAFLRRDWVNETSYRGMVLIELLSVIGGLVMFYSIGKLVGGEPTVLRRYGGDYFAFALVGLAVSGYFSVALIAFSNRLRQAQSTGTLEAMFVTATPPTTVLILSGAWDFLIATACFLAFVSLGVLVLGVRFHVNLLALAPLAFLSLLSFTALGLLAAALILVAKRGDSLALLVNLVANVFGGVVFPVTLLPSWVRPFAYLVPLSYALDGLRRAALVDAGPRAVAGSLLALGIATVVLIPTAWLAVQWAIDRTRRDGSIAHY